MVQIRMQTLTSTRIPIITLSTFRRPAPSPLPTFTWWNVWTIRKRIAAIFNITIKYRGAAADKKTHAEVKTRAPVCGDPHDFCQGIECSDYFKYR